MKRLLYLAITLLFIVTAWYVLVYAQHPGRPIRYVAYVGFNYSDPVEAEKRKYFDQMHIAALEMYLERLNKGEADYGAIFRLKKYECNFDSARIPAIYQEIAADPGIVLVVDNTWGKHIKEAKDIIRQDSLPVIALSADQNGLPFGHSAIFLDPNDPKPLFLIQYIRRVLGAHSVGFLTEEDYLLNQRFVNLMRQDTLQFRVLAHLSQKDQKNNTELYPEKAKAFQRNLGQVLSNRADSVILLNTHLGYGNELFNFLRTADNIPPKYILGLPGTTNLDPKILEEISKKGHTIIGLEVGAEAFPLLLENDWTALQRKYPPAMFSHERTNINLRRCFDAMNIFQTALENHQNTREGIATYFYGLPSKKIHINDELYEIDSSNILLRDPGFNETSGGTTRSSPVQINTSGKPIPCLQVGVDVLGISDVDIKGNSFNCNLLYWVIGDTANIRKEGYIGFENINSSQAKKESISEERHGKYVVRLYRISGKFTCDFETFDFPFDRHELRIPVSVFSSSDELKVSFDINRLKQLDKKKKKVFEISDWKNGAYTVTLDNQITNRLGSLSKITTDTNNLNEYLEKYKTLNIRLNISRQPWGAFILIILPLLMFTILPLFMLFFHKISFDDIGELIITSFLAAVAYSINLVQLSPTTDSMNRAYWFLLLTLTINFLCFLYVTYSDKQSTKEKPKSLKIGNLSVPYLLLILFVMLCYFIFR